MHVGMHDSILGLRYVDKGSLKFVGAHTHNICTHAHTPPHTMNSSKCPSSEVDSTSNAGGYLQPVNISLLVLITFEVYIHTRTG